MNPAQPNLETVTGFNVYGLQARTKNSDEFNANTAKLSELWQKFYACDLAHHTRIYGVYSNYESDANGLYTVTAGITDADHHPDFSMVIIPNGDYLVFKNRGPMPDTVIATWQQVWDYFSKQTAYQRRFSSDFEAYTGPDEVAIYIGVQ